jgi:ABC-type transporter Mla subunit MlaD
MDEAQVNRRARLLFAAVLLVIVAAGGLWLLVTSASYTTYRIDTADAVSGLIADAPVELHGVEVGRVKSVELAGPRAVTILVDVKNGAPVTSATVATVTARGLAMRGFTGYVYVALEDTGAQRNPLAILPGQRYPVIPARASQVASLDLAISQVNDNVQALTRIVQTLLDPATVASLKDSVASVERVSRTLARNDERLERLLVNGERASADVPAFMHSSRATLERVDALLDPRTVETLRQLAGSLDRVTTMLAENDAKLRTLIGRSEEATRDLAPVLQSTQETLDLLHGQVLPQAHRTLTHVDELSTTLNGAARKVDRDPSVLVRGARAPAPGPGEAQ